MLRLGAECAGGLLARFDRSGVKTFGQLGLRVDLLAELADEGLVLVLNHLADLVELVLDLLELNLRQAVSVLDVLLHLLFVFDFAGARQQVNRLEALALHGAKLHPLREEKPRRVVGVDDEAALVLGGQALAVVKQFQEGCDVALEVGLQLLLLPGLFVLGRVALVRVAEEVVVVREQLHLDLLDRALQRVLPPSAAQ